MPESVGLSVLSNQRFRGIGIDPPRPVWDVVGVADQTNVLADAGRLPLRFGRALESMRELG
ncbi:unnamed protein product [marine sediment metagenome]|uniref:Uncharacterized protein n=1 Tax=marine sediment metagenome TaxID=412755 RepID=X0WRW7_9ZZZZ